MLQSRANPSLGKESKRGGTLNLYPRDSTPLYLKRPESAHLQSRILRTHWGAFLGHFEDGDLRHWDVRDLISLRHGN